MRLALIALLFCPVPALAQAPLSIDDLLSGAVAQPASAPAPPEDEPEDGGEAPVHTAAPYQILPQAGQAAPSAYAPTPVTPRYPPAPRPPPPQYTTSPSGPVFIDQLGRTPETAPSPWDLGFESRLRASEDAARGRQGALDGAWLLVGADGQVLYELQIVDPGQGLILLDGAFRDRRRGSTPGASGFLTGVERDGATLRIRLRPRGASAPTLIELQPGATGWTGQIDEPEGKQAVLLRRG